MISGSIPKPHGVAFEKTLERAVTARAAAKRICYQPVELSADAIRSPLIAHDEIIHLSAAFHLLHSLPDNPERRGHRRGGREDHE